MYAIKDTFGELRKERFKTEAAARRFIDRLVKDGLMQSVFFIVKI